MLPIKYNVGIAPPIMLQPAQLLGMYLHLAWASERRQHPQVTDRILVLASELASELGMTAIAAGCRERILTHNPQHLFKNWETVEEAREYEDFAALSRQLRRRYPPEKIEQMLQELGIEIGNERSTYFSDEEYVTALLQRIRRRNSSL